MKKFNFLLLWASVMLVAMSLASCKSSNKPAAEVSRIGEIPEAYHLHDYGFFFNNIKQNVADRIKAYMEKK